MWFSVAQGYHNGKPRGWANGPQCVPWRDRRSAIIDYHDNIIVPELARRGGNHKSPVIAESTLPKAERGFRFFHTITWEQILRDCRHLFEKWDNDFAIVEHAQATGTKTRVVIPKGYNRDLTWLVFLRAISHVFDIDRTDVKTLATKASELRRDLQLDPPQFA